MASGTILLSPVFIQDGYGGNLLRVNDDERVLTDSNVSSTVLAPDAATETTLSAINTKTPALGQTTMSGSSPIAIASDQSAIPITDNGGSLTVDGSVSVSNFPAVQSVDDNGGSLTVDGTVTANVGTTGGLALETTQLTLLTELEFETRIGEVQVTPTSNTVLGRLKAIYDSIVARLGTLGQTTMAGSTPVAIASDQTVIPVSDDGYSLTIDNANLDVALSTLASESTLSGFRTDFQNEDFATEATQATLLTELEFETRIGEVQATPTSNTVLGRLKDITDSLAARLGVLGQTTMSGSTPVVIASDQSNVNIDLYDGYGLPISSTDSAEGNRLNVNSHLGAWLGSSAPTVGQKAMSSSVPVTIANDQTPLSVTFSVVGSESGVSFGKRVLGGGTSGNLIVMETTTYNEPTSAAQRSLASSNGNDTSAGTGARTVGITYFDNTGNGPYTETVTLNGTTAVATTATNIRFIEKMEVITSGSNGANQGTITLYGNASGGGGTVGSISVGNILGGLGDRKTLWAHHYIAAGNEAKFSVLICGITSGGSATAAEVFLRTSQPLVANSTSILLADVVLVIGTFERTFTFPPVIPGFSLVTAYAIPAVNNSTITAAFDWSEEAV